MVVRALAGVAIFFSIIFWPFWTSVILLIAAMFLWNAYWEGLAIFFIKDIVFGTAFSGGMLLQSFFLSVAFLIIIEVVKRKLKFYPSLR